MKYSNNSNKNCKKRENSPRQEASSFLKNALPVTTKNFLAILPLEHTEVTLSQWVWYLRSFTFLMSSTRPRHTDHNQCDKILWHPLLHTFHTSKHNKGLILARITKFRIPTFLATIYFSLFISIWNHRIWQHLNSSLPTTGIIFKQHTK